MKRKMLTLVGTLSLFLAAVSAHAQTIKVKGTIPFDFIVNRATLPADSDPLRLLRTKNH